MHSHVPTACGCAQRDSSLLYCSFCRVVRSLGGGREAVEEEGCLNRHIPHVWLMIGPILGRDIRT
jgi:hypothetical protein